MGADGSEAIVLNDVRHGTYKKLVISEWTSDRRGAGRRCRGWRCGISIDPQREPIARIRNRMMFGRLLALPSERRDPMSGSSNDGRRSRSARHAHDLSLLRRRLRHIGDAGRRRWCGDLGRSRASRQFRTAVLERFGARETLSPDSRLLYPMIRCSKGTMERVAWPDALDHVAHRFKNIVARDGPDAVAFLSLRAIADRDYYVANKLMKGSSAAPMSIPISRLCMASSVAGHRRAFGADTVPGCYEDLDQADLLVLAAPTRRGAIRFVPAHARQQAAARRADGR